MSSPLSVPPILFASFLRLVFQGRGWRKSRFLCVYVTFVLSWLPWTARAAEQVIISEFMASNKDTLRDGYGNASDWIELYNAGSAPVELSGWHLTDNPQNLAQWTFPASTLGPGQFLVVFASGQGAPDPSGYFHANFQLNADGEYLALVRPDLSVATAFAPAFPPQRDDISYGLAQQSLTTAMVRSGSRAKMLVPTAANASLDTAWLGGAEPFDDSSWLSVTNPIGYDSQAVAAPATVNVALGRPVYAAGETWPGLPKENLTDGSLTTVTHNNAQSADFYFMVDLGGLFKLETIELFNRTDCCPERLSNFTVTLLDDAGDTPGPTVWSANIRTNNSNSGPGGRDVITPGLDPNGTFVGRWIKVQARADGGLRYFQIAELRANAANWASRAPVFASGATVTGFPKENLTDGNLATFSHNLDPEPAFAYQVRLTQAVAFTRLELFNRNDGCCPERLSHYRVTVHPDNGGAIGPAVWSADLRLDNSNSGVGGQDILLPQLDPGATFEGQWIQIQNLDVGTDRYLQIAEVRAFGLGGSSGYGSFIRRDVTAEMKGVNSSVWLRTPFVATNLSSLDQLTFRVRHDDGFVAWLNGVEVARANAPPSPLPYNARAASAHYATAPQEFNVPLALLREGTNILACHGLNLDAGDRDFLLYPELNARASTSGSYGYLLTPSPRGVNSSNTLAGFVDDPRFSIDRGFFEGPIDVVITSPTPGATLVYTTNASIPTLSNGFVRPPADANSSVTTTVRVATTTILRAAAFKTGLQPSAIDSHTYLFLADVIRQPSNPPGFPAAWSGAAADYAMDPDVVTNAAYRNEIIADLRSIPTMSIVMQPADVFGNVTGIYYFPEQVGDAWERAASVELIKPDGTTGFQVNCGIRVWGTGWRPHSSSPKHALQLKFQSQYGPKKLRYPLFPDTTVTEFDNLVLRAQGSRSWMDFRQPDIQQTQYIHDSWARDTAHAMGITDGHATYVHLYINGLYWGLYNPVEKTDEGFAEVYYGGDKSEYDVITRRGAPEVDAGDLTAWNQMMTIVNGGVASAQQYALLQQYLDVDAFIDHMMIHQYASNHDGPTFGIANNMRAIRRRVPGGQFRFHVWDMEYTFWYPLENNLAVDTDQSPARIFQRLRANPEFRLRYADHAQKHLLNNGALTPGPAAARWQARAAEIYGAVVGESARWGDVRRANLPYTRNVEWTIELNRLLNEYFPIRAQVYLEQLRAAGLFPKISAPSFSQPGGDVPPGTQLHLNAPAGTVYYTLDGTDPRVAGGGILPGAIAYTPTTLLVSTSSPARYLVPTSAVLDSTWTGGNPAFDDSAWSTRPGPTLGFDTTATPALSAVPLQNASADFSETGRGVNLAIDATPSTTGWGLFEAQDYSPKARGAIAVFETVTNVGFPEGTRLVFTLRHGLSGQLSLGKFRLSATTDDRGQFGDGLNSRGDIVANWVPLMPLAATAAAGGTMTINSDGSILVSGSSPATNAYTITAITPMIGITGFRLEAMEDSSLPVAGPGRGGNGNAVLTDFAVQAAPATLTHLLDGGAGALQAGMLNRNASVYLRVPFEVEPEAVFDQLLLRVRYEDGFVAYLNGREVARRNAPGPAAPAWNTAAASNRANREALEFETIDLGNALTNLVAGANTLAIQGLNESAASPDFLLQTELVARTDLPIDLGDSTTVKARVLLNGDWSALSEGTFTSRVPLRFTELMYHPLGEIGVSGDEFEFLELKNTGNAPFNLSGFTFTTGISFTFTNGTFLGAGQRLVLVRNPVQFARRYPGVPIHGVYNGRLDDGGETISLARPLGPTVLSLTYGDAAPWPVTPDGFGFSLVPKAPGAPPSEEASAWRASASAFGSPGTDDPEPNLPAVLINEVLTASVLPEVDWIELHNPTTQQVDISGWFLTDERTVPMKFRLPPQTRIPAGGYLTFTESNFNPVPATTNNFQLSSGGEAVYLFSGGPTTNLTGYSHGFSFGAAAPGVSFGRYLISTGQEQFPPQTASTTNGPNAGPRIGPVVISEIMYHPPPGGDEFVELKNITSNPVELFDRARPTNTWRLGGLDYDFPTNLTLGANSLLLLVPTTPQAFRNKYGVPANVLILGPYPGQLQDSGERLELARPEVPTTNGVPYVAVDEVRYNDRAPWPGIADGNGPSLQRPNPGSYANDPANWRSAAPSPGRDFGGGVPPSITVAPFDQTVVRNQNAQMMVGASGTFPLLYQWQAAGTNVPGATNALLTLTNVQLAQAGAYRATVFNSAGAVTSAVALLTVLNPPTIVTQPQGKVVPVGTNVTLNVSAIGNGVLQYQWRFNGQPITDATNSSLAFTSIQETNSGDYTVVVSDSVGSIQSEPASILALTRPVITESPQAVTALVGETVTLQVSASGSLPLSFRWRRNGASYTNLILNAHTSTLLFTNVQPSQAAAYSVVVTNLVGSANTTNATLTVLVDTDGDHVPDDWELIAGTDPNDPASYLKIDSLTATNAITLSFRAVSNKTYAVQYREQLGVGPWKRLLDVGARPTNHTAVIIDADINVNRSYRLATPAPSP